MGGIKLEATCGWPSELVALTAAAAMAATATVVAARRQVAMLIRDQLTNAKRSKMMIISRRRLHSFYRFEANGRELLSRLLSSLKRTREFVSFLVLAIIVVSVVVIVVVVVVGGGGSQSVSRSVSQWSDHLIG